MRPRHHRTLHTTLIFEFFSVVAAAQSRLGKFVYCLKTSALLFKLVLDCDICGSNMMGDHYFM